MKRAFGLACIVAALLTADGQNPLSTNPGHLAVYDGADWHLKGEGIVACPCKTPCPCRSNDKASYGHCEATLYLHVRQGHYGAVKLDDTRLVNMGGACAMSYQHLAALYFDRSTSREQQVAFMKLMSSFLSTQSAEFPYVRTVDINARVTGGHLYQVSIPGTLEMIVDRNWGRRAAPPMPMFAASDYFSNTLQYAQNLRYVIHDDEAKLDFDYSRRQANYRDVDLDVRQYRSKQMLIQFQDGKGGFSDDQQRLIRELSLPLPDLAAMRQTAARYTKRPQEP